MYFQICIRLIFFVIKKYYFESKLLKSPIFEKQLTIIASKNELKCLVGYSFKIVFCFPKQGEHFWFIFFVHFWFSWDQIKML